MRIIHRISFNSSPVKQHELAEFGIHVPDSGVVVFDIDETDRSWINVNDWVARRDALDIVKTTFSKDEQKNSAHLQLLPAWHHGYPQPDEDNLGFWRVTYDLADSCEHCGTGRKQKAPFQMKREPDWRAMSILQLNWVFDEFFVKPDVWSRVFEPHGIACRDVVSSKGATLKTVVQLVITNEVDIVSHNLPVSRCVHCGRTKHPPHKRGPFPALSKVIPGAMARTQQYFGSGGHAFRGVLITQGLARSMERLGVRGATLRPVAQNSDG